MDSKDLNSGPHAFSANTLTFRSISTACIWRFSPQPGWDTCPETTEEKLWFLFFPWQSWVPWSWCSKPFYAIEQCVFWVPVISRMMSRSWPQRTGDVAHKVLPAMLRSLGEGPAWLTHGTKQTSRLQLRPSLPRWPPTPTHRLFSVLHAS